MYVIKSARERIAAFRKEKSHGLNACGWVYTILLTLRDYFHFWKNINHKICFLVNGSMPWNMLQTLALFLKQLYSPRGAQGLNVESLRNCPLGSLGAAMELSLAWQHRVGPFSFQHMLQRDTGHSPLRLEGQHAQHSGSSCQHCFTDWDLYNL